ncbi:MAG: DUF1579 family protein [Deltaproteobacteria bacterium]|nr:DUF1579 family protein [Deltaproteobacteria bacterium]
MNTSNSERVIRRWKLVLGCAFASLLSTANASANKPKMVAPPKPPANVAAAFKFFIGSWQCTNSFHGLPGTPVVPPRKTKGRWTNKVVLNGHWMAGDAWELSPKGKVHVASMLIGYDPAASRFIGFGASGNGSHVNFSSEGWKDAVWTDAVEAKMGGHTMQMRVQIKQLGPRKLETSNEIKTPQGSWHKVKSGVCTR